MTNQDVEDPYPFIGGSFGDEPGEVEPGEVDPAREETLHFEADDLGDRLAAASEEGLDEADFGLIQVDEEGTVQFYNAFESSFAGVAKADAVGRNFFTEVAPCSNNSLFYGRFRKLRDQDRYSDRFSYTFTYKMRPTLVHVRLLNDADGRHWIAVQPQ